MHSSEAEQKGRYQQTCISGATCDCDRLTTAAHTTPCCVLCWCNPGPHFLTSCRAGQHSPAPCPCCASTSTASCSAAANSSCRRCSGAASCFQLLLADSTQRSHEHHDRVTCSGGRHKTHAKGAVLRARPHDAAPVCAPLQSANPHCRQVSASGLAHTSQTTDLTPGGHNNN